MKTLRQFEIVTEIVRQESISKAAQVLGVSQPTISKILHNLETDLGLELFDRTVMPLRLTKAGERYVSAAEKIVDIDRQLTKELAEIRLDINKTLSIGISPSRAPYILPRILHEYRKIDPKCRITVKESDMNTLNDELSRGEVDIIISLLSDDTRAFMREPLFTETVLLAAPAFLADTDSAEILKTKAVITIGKGLWLWKLTDKILDFVGGEKPVIECQSIESALALVKKGIGTMLVPSYIARSGDTGSKIVFKELPQSCQKRFEGDLKREACVFYRSNAFLSEAETRFIDICKKSSCEFNKKES